MTDKENNFEKDINVPSKKPIMINGVDVRKCDFYNKDKGYCLTLKMNPKGFKNPSCFSGDFQECIQSCKTCPYTFCHSNSNCYYKQLQRKIQEYEEYKKLAADFKDVNKQLGYKYLTIKKECEELKEENQQLRMHFCNDCGEKDDYNIPCKIIRDLDYELQKEIEENDHYREALKEIERICLEDTYTFADGTQIRYDSLDDILDIINKVKKGEADEIL